MLAPASVPGALFGLDDAWHLWPQIVAVVEGQARGATEPPPLHAYSPGSLRLFRATRDGDQAIVDVVADLAPSLDVTVVTSDRALRSRVEALGARTVGAGTLLRMLPT
ncbi:MAG: NYN domain-containing protein [Mycobacteriaceae bacterium]